MQFKKPVCKLTGLLALGLVGHVLPAQAATYYVTPSTTLINADGLSEANATQWVTAQGRAAADPATNDTIIFLPGRYNRENIGATGRDDALLSVPTNTTIKAKNRAQSTSDVTQRSVLTGIYRPSKSTKSPQFQFVLVDGQPTSGAKTDVIVDGFEIDGSGVNGSDPTTGRSQASAIVFKNDCRKIQALNNLIHDVGGAGVITFRNEVKQESNTQNTPGGADYVTIKGNRIYNGSRWLNAGGGGSGISMLGTYNTGPAGEDGRTVHNFIQNNRIYNQNTLLTGAEADKLTDNNGIIIDLTGGHDAASSVNRRPARTLVENNVVYGNDGRGIHVFKSSNVLVRNNTCYQNLVSSKWTNEGELSAVLAKDVLFVNNVAYADGTNQPITYQNFGAVTSNASTIIFRYNATGNGTNVYTGATQYGNVEGVTNADFQNPSAGNFINVVRTGTTKAQQKIIDVGSSSTVAGVTNNNDFAPNDFYGASRPMGTRVDRGAFETSYEGAPRQTVARTSSAGSG